MQIILPIKTTSKRCKNKNLRPFCDINKYGGRSLFQVKLQQLKESGIDDKDIIIPTDNIELVEEQVGKNCYRWVYDGKYNKTFADALDFWLTKVDNDDIMVVHCTTPFFSDFSSLIETWYYLQDSNLVEKNPCDSMVVVRPYKHFLINDKCEPVNFQYGPWHKTSELLPDLYEMCCSAFIIKTEVAKHCHYYIGKNPYLVEYSGPHIDIDTEEDFEVAQLLYKHYG